jgi:hypothetical protein
LNQVNGSSAPPCPGDCTDCAGEQRLTVLADRLRQRGLEISFDTCDSQTKDGHYDSVTVTNPSQSERGSLHIDSDDEVMWHYPGAKLDDDGIGRLLDEAINALRANGMRLPRRRAEGSS